MSYSRSYSGSVSYSGYASYSASYPASQSGGSVSGTVHYSGSVPVTVNLFVDTDPFDSSALACSHSVGALNGAVVAMNGAQVKSIRDSAREVSSHVSKGFFNLIGSELKQSMTALYSKFQSLCVLMESKSQTLEKQQFLMQDDYSRISARYEKTFQELDEELEKEIFALDKNVFKLSRNVQSQMLHGLETQKVAEFLTGVNEGEIVNQELVIANTKSRVLNAIDRMASNVVQESVYSKKVDGIIRNEKNDKALFFMPVLYTESTSLDGKADEDRCFSALNSEDQSLKAFEGVKNYFSVSGISENSEAENKKIDEAFALIAEKEFSNLRDEKSLRVYELVKKLKESGRTLSES